MSISELHRSIKNNEVLTEQLDITVITPSYSDVEVSYAAADLASSGHRVTQLVGSDAFRFAMDEIRQSDAIFLSTDKPLDDLMNDFREELAILKKVMESEA